MKKKKIKIVDATPTWIEILPMLTHLLKSKKQKDQHLAYHELCQMAKAADAYNNLVKPKE